MSKYDTTNQYNLKLLAKRYRTHMDKHAAKFDEHTIYGGYHLDTTVFNPDYVTPLFFSYEENLSDIFYTYGIRYCILYTHSHYTVFFIKDEELVLMKELPKTQELSKLHLKYMRYLLYTCLGLEQLIPTQDILDFSYALLREIPQITD